MRPLDEQLRGLVDGGVNPVTAEEAQCRAADSSSSRTSPWFGLARNTRVPVALAIGVALAVGVATVLVLDGSSNTHQIATPGTTDRPLPAVIIATRGNEVVELSADGAVQRVVAMLPAREQTSISVSSDGKTALVTDGANPRRCPGPAPEVGSGLTRVDLATGSTESIDLGPGVNGAVFATFSPDATKFAFIEYGCELQNALVIRDMSGNELRRFTVPFASPVDGNHQDIINVAGWEPDGRELLVLVQHEPTSELWTIDTETPSGVLTGTKLATPEGIPATVKPLEDSGRWAAVLLPNGYSQPSQVVEYDPATAAVVRVLFTWTDIPPEDGPGAIAAVDPTGRHLLLIVNRNGGPQVLYRWSEGDDQPTKLAEGISAVAWLPQTDVAPTTDPTMPRVTTAPAAVGNRYIPPTTLDGDTVIAPVTVPDGRQFELRYPQGLGIAELGFITGTTLTSVADISPPHERGALVSYTTVAAAYGDAQPDATYQGIGGAPVLYFASHPSAATPGLTEPDVLVFQFGPWMVQVHDLEAGSGATGLEPMTESERALLAASLGARIDEYGYLVLEPRDPIGFGDGFKTEFVFGVNQFFGGVGSVVVPFTMDDLDSSNKISVGPTSLCGDPESDTAKARRLAPSSGGEDAAAWCDGASGLHINVEGTKDFVDAAIRDFKIRALKVSR